MKRLLETKNIILYLAVGFILVCLLGNCTSCSGSKNDADSGSSENEVSETSSQGSESDSEGEIDLDNLQVGQTADFKKYSITLNSIARRDGFLFANLTMHAHKDSTFSSDYLTASNEDGDKIEHSSDLIYQNVPAGSEYTGDLYFKDCGINDLYWNNWSNECHWRFEDDDSNNPNKNPGKFQDEPPEVLAAKAQKEAEANEAQSAETPQEQTASPAEQTPAQPEEPTYESGAGLTALEDYGKRIYGSEFELDWFAGMISTQEVGPNQYFLKYTCHVPTGFGGTYDAVCEATVSGTGNAPYTYNVADFSVY